MKIVADNTVPYLKGIAEPIAEVKYLTSKEFTPENVKDADILIVRKQKEKTASFRWRRSPNKPTSSPYTRR